ncbi:MAG: 2-C-methyl-D-erythritol 2,4-cyclodiphosphate synthase [Leptospirales bacterium]
MSGKFAIIIAAGGQGKRMGSSRPKQFLLLSQKPLFAYSLGTFLAWEKVGVVCLGVPEAFREESRSLLRDLFPQDLKAGRLLTFEGGARRQDTVALGVRLVVTGFPGISSIMVHDAARPFLSREILERAGVALEEGSAFGVGIPATDTLWSAPGDSSLPILASVISRTGVFRAQTPQGAPVSAFIEAIDKALHSGDPEFTDEAGLLHWAGLPVRVIQGEETNRKVTTPEDMAWAQDYLHLLKKDEFLTTDGDSSNQGRIRWPRVGQGIDVHPFEEGRALWLGGVLIPHSKGLAGHSDADAVIHALCDALLGAVGQGDIGRHFPPSDERYRGQNSLFFLERIVEIVRREGYVPYQADLTIVAERPKISPYASKMQDVLSKALGVAPNDISIKATTSEKLGFTGREEGLTVLAVATVIASSSISS